MTRLLITGGNGFIGREIARLAVEDGLEVRSISRSGRPAVDAPWVEAVDWHAADVFEPHRWRDELDGCDALIHTVAAIRDSPKQGVTLERMCGDSAILAGLEAERADLVAFVFLSAMGTPPFVDERFLTAKRRAERELSELNLRTSVLRPGPVYGTETNPGHFPPLLNRILRGIDGKERIACRLGEKRPVSVVQLARVSLRAAFDDHSPRLMEIPEISSQSGYHR